MLAKRIIPCLDIKEGKTVKGINFNNLKECGDPIDLALRYSQEGADELVFLDITATLENRKTFSLLVKDIAANISIPFTVGGGIRTIKDAHILLNSGADKITINSAAINNPLLIKELKNTFGSQFIVAAIDAKKVNDTWMVTKNSGTVVTNLELYNWAKTLQDLGAGEILFTSMDNDGKKCGYACDVYKNLSRILDIPIIASGGAGSTNDIIDVLSNGMADAALAASIFHYGNINIKNLKEELTKNKITVRL